MEIIAFGRSAIEEGVGAGIARNNGWNLGTIWVRGGLPDSGPKTPGRCLVMF